MYVCVGLKEWTIAGQWEAMRGGWRLTAEGTLAH